MNKFIYKFDQSFIFFKINILENKLFGEGGLRFEQ